MSDVENQAEEASKVVIGLSFGNTNSSISFVAPDGKPEVIANEEGGEEFALFQFLTSLLTFCIQIAKSPRSSHTLGLKNTTVRRQRAT